MKDKLKKCFRKIINAKEYEKITDAIDRHKNNIIKNSIGRKVLIKEETFFAELVSLGIKKGDVIMVHCSWRKFYGYEGSPESFLNKLIDLVGEEGTILMPSYGNQLDYFYKAWR